MDIEGMVDLLLWHYYDTNVSNGAQSVVGSN